MPPTRNHIKDQVWMKIQDAGRHGSMTDIILTMTKHTSSPQSIYKELQTDTLSREGKRKGEEKKKK